MAADWPRNSGDPGECPPHRHKPPGWPPRPAASTGPAPARVDVPARLICRYAAGKPPVVQHWPVTGRSTPAHRPDRVPAGGVRLLDLSPAGTTCASRPGDMLADWPVHRSIRPIDWPRLRRWAPRSRATGTAGGRPGWNSPADTLETGPGGTQTGPPAGRFAGRSGAAGRWVATSHRPVLETGPETWPTLARSAGESSDMSAKLGGDWPKLPAQPGLNRAAGRLAQSRPVLDQSSTAASRGA